MSVYVPANFNFFASIFALIHKPIPPPSLGGIRPTANPEKEPTHHVKKPLEPLVGFEPTTYSLRMNCSTPELQRPNSLCGGRFLAKASRLATVIFEYVLVVSQSPVFNHSRILPIISRNWLFPRPSTIRTRSFVT